jgi:hypothetical protein
MKELLLRAQIQEHPDGEWLPCGSDTWIKFTKEALTTALSEVAKIAGVSTAYGVQCLLAGSQSIRFSTMDGRKSWRISVVGRR